ncbi:MAG: ribosome silencing factor [Coriobacteriia bacterium]|nr:ribosome silencing factor [Coriobacteriia bacterium]MCL2871106.1 ribosome silencing factor [Coriobacteriia bacterium]
MTNGTTDSLKTTQDSTEFNSKNLVKVAFEAALEKKATDIMALDMKELLVVTDYFVLATGSSDIQVSAIATEIEKQLQEQCGIKPAHKEGADEGKWVLLDYLDIVVHLFQPDFREEYRIEDLWSQAKKLRAAAPDTVGEEKAPIGKGSTGADTKVAS